MIDTANMELYIQLLREYTACLVHPMQIKPLEPRPGDNEPQLKNPPEVVTPDELPDVPPEPEGLPDISPTPEGITVVPPDEDDDDKEDVEDEEAI